MKTLVAIAIMSGLILVLSTVPGYSHGVSWGVSVNFGGVPYYGYAPVYPVYPTYIYYAPAPVYRVCRPGFAPPVRCYPGGYYRPYYHPRYHWR